MKVSNLKYKKGAVNLCDLFGKIQDVTEEDGLELFLDKLPIGMVDRIYIGSYFCSNYFLNQPYVNYCQIIKSAIRLNYKITLVIPPLFEKDLSKAKKLIKALIQEGDVVIDEVTINDFGMLVMQDIFKGKKINMGRLLQKDNRDPRYREYFNETHEYRSFSEYYRAFYQEKQIAGVEVDCTNKAVILPDDLQNTIIAVHVPFCYISMGSICEFASMSKEKSKRFVFADNCTMGCNDAHIECLIQDGIKLYRIGRSVLFLNEGCEIIGDVTKYRIVYSPIKELFGGTYENTCAFK